MINDIILHKWIEGTLTPPELKEFKKRPEYETLKKLFDATIELEGPDFNSEAMLEQILGDKSKSETPVSTFRLPSWIKYGVAASILLWAATFFWSYNGTVEFAAGPGMTFNGSLPDNSTFILNAESILKYNENNWLDKRSVVLDGEAYFNVEKGASFIVKTQMGNVEVLGTSFNVRLRNDILDVKCKEGKVRVSFKNGANSETLIAEQGLRLHSGKVVRDDQLSKGDESWFTGITKLNDLPFSEVLDEIERQFDVRISRSDIDLNEKISCTFTHNDLNRALLNATTPMGINFKILNSKEVTLMKK